MSKGEASFSVGPNVLHQRLAKKRREATLLASPLHVKVRRHLILASISTLTV